MILACSLIICELPVQALPTIMKHNESYHPTVETLPVDSCSIAVSLSAVPTTGTAPLTVTFYTQVSGATPPVQYDWWFGDGTHLTGKPTETYTYNSPYTYNVFVRVLDWHGCWSQTSVTVEVLGSQSGSLIPALVVVGVLIVFAAVGIVLKTIASRRRDRTGFRVQCSRCGWHNSHENEYCAKCGTRLDQTRMY